MQLIHTSALVVHVLTGLFGLLAGTIIMFIRKGGKLHRKLGILFFYCLLGVSFSAITLALVNPNTFLLLIGGFTLYQGLSGYRAVRVRLKTIGVADVLICALGAASAVPMLLSGQPVLQVFGGICALLVARDINMFRLFMQQKPVPKLLWLQRHIGHMMGSYIAMVTAFLVVNFSGSTNHALVVWLAPTAIGVPLLVYWTFRYRGRTPAARSGRAEQAA